MGETRATDQPKVGGRPVLVVDDEPEIRAFVQLALEDEGYAVRAASNGAEALEALREVRPCVILLDLRMPGMDGVTFVETYRKRAAAGGKTGAPAAPTAPIIVLTASRMPEDDVASLGVQGVLRKPFEVTELLETIARHVSGAPATHPPDTSGPTVLRRHAACVPTNGETESGGAGTRN